MGTGRGLMNEKKELQSCSLIMDNLSPTVENSEPIPYNIIHHHNTRHPDQERVMVLDLVRPSLREAIGRVSCQLFYRIKKNWPANDNNEKVEPLSTP